MQTEVPDNQRAAFDALARDLMLRHPGEETGKMFGLACIKVAGKTFVAFQDGAAAFKLAGGDHRAALALAGARRWDPSGKRRPMREWVWVPFDHAPAWLRLAEQSRAYIAH